MTHSPASSSGQCGRQRGFQPFLRQTVQRAVLNALLDQRVHFCFQGRFVFLQANEARRVFQHKARHRGFRRVLARNGRHHEIAGRHVLHLAGQICRQRGVVVFVALHVRVFRRQAGQHHVLHRPARHADGFSAERGGILQFSPFRAKHAEEKRRVGAAEVDYLLALRVFTEAGNDQVHLVGLQVRHAVGAGHRYQLQLELHLFSEIARHVDVIALRLQIGSHRAKRREILRNGDANCAAFLNILKLVSLCRQLCEEACCPGQCNQQFFHGASP